MHAKSDNILVINAGSSSIKFCLYTLGLEKRILSGKLDGIGEIQTRIIIHDHINKDTLNDNIDGSPVFDHQSGMIKIFSLLTQHGTQASPISLHAVGHRVVHGGENFSSATIIDKQVIDGIKKTMPLAPLHNKACLNGIETALRLYPQVPQVAVFDTAFFQSLPAIAYHYALPRHLYEQQHIRRYGFHGTSHQYVTTAAASYLSKPLEKLRLISLHLGNGASIAAILNGCCIDTSMGMTPLEGLIMGTRCGDIDPSIPFYLNRETGMNFQEIEAMLNNESGMKGLCGKKDMRDIHRLANEGDKQARLAIDMYCYRIIKYIGAYYTALGGLDALIFTAGVGENDASIREQICNGLSVLGISIEQTRNQSDEVGIIDISHDKSRVKLLVIPSDEELEIARQTLATLNLKNGH